MKIPRPAVVIIRCCMECEDELCVLSMILDLRCAKTYRQELSTRQDTICIDHCRLMLPPQMLALPMALVMVVEATFSLDMVQLSLHSNK